MKRRPRRSVPAALTALALLAAAVVVAVSAIQTLLGEQPWLSYDTAARTLHDLQWTDLPVAIAGLVVAVLGLVLLLAAILPGALTVLPLKANADDVDAGVCRRSYLSTLRAAASTVDGVAHAKLKLHRRTVAAVVRTDRAKPDGLDGAVRSALTERLEQIQPATPPKLKVVVKAPRSR
ncbi:MULTISPECIES: DUF6286 domain-containing protein [Amycolatopsis methanolica group]|uniref:DUF6286 domain-containing protein n=1 Tax=Amycolatopsis methanolica 239 TaxID=1068978 RepID=A0A076MVN3_AMYME|nr:DUF6286 domain-containing protein [Amycolatopsis methanolica]AIJ24759.1 hypothetical protein AMETH_4667 [Amycolatopsis methanolica 239]